MTYPELESRPRVVGLYGAKRRKPDDNRAFVALSNSLTGSVPLHPPAADHLADLHGGWLMLGNGPDPANAAAGVPAGGAGDCVAVTWANMRRLVTTALSRTPVYPPLKQVVQLYKTQNPGFPSQDGGMDIQACLDTLHHVGGPDGVRSVAHAKVDHTSQDEVKAAIAIFGSVWVAIDVSSANEDEFSTDEPWDYHPGDDDEGGHSILVGGYGPAGAGPLGGDERFITWAQETSFTEQFWQHRVLEAWVVIWPEHLGSKAFLAGVDVAQLAEDYLAVTGKQLVIPTPPPPSPVPPLSKDQAKACKVLDGQAELWLRHAHTAGNATFAASVTAWRKAMGYAT